MDAPIKGNGPATAATATQAGQHRPPQDSSPSTSRSLSQWGSAKDQQIWRDQLLLSGPAVVATARHFRSRDHAKFFVGANQAACTKDHQGHKCVCVSGSAAKGSLQVVLRARLRVDESKWIEVRALADTGATHNCMAKRLTDEFGLPIDKKHATTGEDFQGKEATFFGLHEALGIAITTPNGKDDPLQLDRESSKFLVTELNGEYEVILGLPWWERYRAVPVYATDSMGSDHMVGVTCYAPRANEDGRPRTSFTFMSVRPPSAVENVEFDWSEPAKFYIDKAMSLERFVRRRPRSRHKYAAKITAYRATAAHVEWTERCQYIVCDHDVPLAHACAKCNRDKYEMTPSIGASNGLAEKESEVALKRFLADYPHVFEEPSEEVPYRTNLRFYQHAIELESGKTPGKRAYIRLPPDKQRELRRQIDEMIRFGWVQHSNSPYSAPTFLVPKPDGGWRMVVDYRALNDCTKKDAYPLPHAGDMFENLRGSTIFSKLDLRSGFYQIPLRKGDEPLTAFATVDGLFEYKVVPMGLCNAPATFMRFMNEAFGDMIREGFVVVFMDDIVIHSRNKEEHEKHLHRVFKRLAELRLHVKMSKCKLFGTEIGFLGHYISAKSMRMAPHTQLKIREWPAPKSKHQVRSFIALAQYYAKFMKDFSKIAAPLTDLTRKDVKFVWEDVHQQAFDAIKTCLGDERTVLLRYNHELPIVIATDACDTGAGAVLQQDPDGKGLRPVEFYSYKFTTSESRWTTYDKEALAVVLALSNWRHLVEGNRHRVHIQCDHRPLIFFAAQHKSKRTRDRWSRWAAELNQYCIKWEYVEGKSNGPADYMSRLYQEDEPEEEANNGIDIEQADRYLSSMDAETFAALSQHYESLQDKVSQAAKDTQHESVSDRFRISVSAAHALRRLSNEARAAARATRRSRLRAPSPSVEKPDTSGSPERSRGCTTKVDNLCHIHRQKEYGVTIRETPDAGKGLFATRNFKRNELIVEYTGDILTPNSEDEDAQPLSAYIQAINAPQGRSKEVVTLVDNKEVKKAVPLRANAKVAKTHSTASVQVRATRNIKAGEEILTAHGNSQSLPNVPAISAVTPKARSLQRGQKAILLSPVLRYSSQLRASSAPIISALTARNAAESIIDKHWRSTAKPNLAPLSQKAEPAIKETLERVEQLLGDEIVPSRSAARPVSWTSEVSVEELSERFMQAAKEDKQYQDKLITLLSGSGKEPHMNVIDDLIVENGALVVPANEELRTSLISTAHETEGHLGVDKTFRSLSKRYIWGGMKKQVEEFCKGCYRCQVNKPPQRKHQGTMSPLPAPEKPCEWWTIDIVGPLPETKNGNKFVVVMVDRFSKVKRIVPWKCMPSAEDIITIVEQWIVRFHGLPSTITSDRGAQFTSTLWRSYTSELGINLRISSAYHPQTDGQTERDNRTIQQLMRIYCDGDTKTWDKHVHLIELALNTMTQSSTGFSAFEILYGQPGLKLLDVTLEEIKRLAKLGTRTEIPLREDGQPHTEPISMGEQDGPAAKQLRQLREGLVAAKDAIEESRKQARHSSHNENEESSEVHRLHEAFLRNRADQLTATRQRVINNINETAAKMQRQAPRRAHDIKPGDLVLLSQEHMRSSDDAKASSKGESRKLKDLYFKQPYEVRNTTLNTVELKLHDGDKFHPVVNVDRVKKLFLHTPRNSSKKQSIPDSQDPVEDDTFDVEAIVAHRWNPSARRLEWEVKWVGYNDTTWEPRTNLTNNEYFKRYIMKYPIKAVKAEAQRNAQKVKAAPKPKPEAKSRKPKPIAPAATRSSERLRAI
jgi:transposase InsO family protein